MGAAAYNRGSAAISQQIAAEGKASRLVPIDRYTLQGMEDEIARLRAENERLTAENARARRSVQVLRATMTCERVARAEEQQRKHSHYVMVVRKMVLFERRWSWVSRLLRRSAAPAQVHAAWAELVAEGCRPEGIDR